MQMQTPWQEETHSQRNHENVVKARPDQIGSDFGEDSATQIQSGNDIEEVGPHEDNISCLNGHGCAGRQCDAERRRYQSR
jgi:hypothetical protein